MRLIVLAGHHVSPKSIEGSELKTWELLGGMEDNNIVTDGGVFTNSKQNTIELVARPELSAFPVKQ